jgi:Ca-activated chloride channel homolog
MSLENRVGPKRDPRPALVSAIFALLLTSGLGTWPAVRAQLCPSILVASSNEKSPLMTAFAKEYSAERRTDWTGCPDAVAVEQVASGTAERELAEGWTGPGRPDAWSPAATSWVNILSEHLAKTGRAPMVPAGPLQKIAQSPLVVAVPQKMATAAGWDRRDPTWQELTQLAEDPLGWGKYGHPEWGRFRMGITDPGQSTSGFHSLTALFYAAAGDKPNLTPADVANPQNRAFVQKAELVVSDYAPTAGNLLNNLAGAPGSGSENSYLSALPAEEQEVFTYNDGGYGGGRPQLAPAEPLVAIYPSDGTLIADHPFVILAAPWVSEAKKVIADGFRKFLQDPAQQVTFEKAGFRDYDGNSHDPLSSEVGIRPVQPRTSFSEPSSSVAAAIQLGWKTLRKPARISIVVALAGVPLAADVSAATATLPPTDQVAVQVVGSAALYTAIAAALQAFNPDPARTDILLVVAAMKEHGSNLRLSDLERLLLTENQEGRPPIRIYTVSLPGSDRAALSGIATASGGVASVSASPAQGIKAALTGFSK